MKLNRHMVQALGTIAFNGDLKNFFQGSINKGDLKKLCVPVLNCYSCPGAIGSCPIGSVQATLNSPKFSFSFYALGLVVLFGILMGRWFCGWLCPFGFFQDLLYKIKIKKLNMPKRVHNILKYGKYFFLIVFVFALPLLTKDEFGHSDPYFCKYVCPQGILQGAFPLGFSNPQLRNAFGLLFQWKLAILIAFIIWSIIQYRPFCKYVCPLGAMYGCLNPVSVYQLKVNDSCIKCNKCTQVCKMEIEPFKTPNSPECIRCNDCVKVCPVKAIEVKTIFSGSEKN